ncbi:DUF6191 domain-containing protein [Pseudonocardia sp. NPDC049154]|uniref:DUF6191 domain-containing protein n=1 Tax=Pseudonocardia sp. NPDC049154 TaxID=3155501 RepID=UPI0033EB999F
MVWWTRPRAPEVTPTTARERSGRILAASDLAARGRRTGRWPGGRRCALRADPARARLPPGPAGGAGAVRALGPRSQPAVLAPDPRAVRPAVAPVVRHRLRGGGRLLHRGEARRAGGTSLPVPVRDDEADGAPPRTAVDLDAGIVTVVRPPRR